MHAVLLTLVIAAGADQFADSAVPPPGYVAQSGSPCESCGDASCESCKGGKCSGAGHALLNAAWDWMGPMPQTCYAPRFGCYPGNNRYMHRYPAFHGSYYRQPYNYRQYFDYPWHAQPHEPMGYFTYEKSPAVDGQLIPVPGDVPAPPAMMPQPAPAPPAPAGVSQSGWKPASHLRPMR